jgi:hypothetical protein
MRRAKHYVKKYPAALLRGYFTSENGVSGLQWSAGRVFWGHTHDDDSPPSAGKRISIDDWIDECIGIMINPDTDEIEDQRRLDKEE